ncbi:MAG: CheR family methyltransferase [Pseudomonadota bacterium]
MTPQDFAFLRDMLRERSGLVLSDDKSYLVESRLQPVAKSNGLNGLPELITSLRKPGSENLKSQITEAMTTNESFFFRDKIPFQNFEEHMLPYMLQARAAKKKLRIWSAAASTGQESYSLSIILKEMAPKLTGWKVDIIGTDLSIEVLEKASAGLYSQFEVQRGLPVNLMVKYFKQIGSLWQIDASIRSMVEYKSFNLLDNLSPLGQFDIVFCRNVLIYFDQATKADVLKRISRQMENDAYLILGAAETIVGLCDDFKMVEGRRGLFQKVSAGQSTRHSSLSDAISSSFAVSK